MKTMQTDSAKSKQPNISCGHFLLRIMTCLILAVGILLSPAAEGFAGPQTVEAASAKSAKKAFKSFLAEGKWGYDSSPYDPAVLSFYYTTFGKAKTPALSHWGIQEADTVRGM